MSIKPLVSVITIFLNEEKFIQEAIDSVFAQTYDHWELLLVDDGSTDRSTQIAKSYAEKHAGKVRYIEHSGHKNRGMSASRNLGVNYAKGKYISYIDGDDVLLPNKLERQVEILETHPEALMVCGPLKFWHSWTGNPKGVKRDCLHGVHPDSNSIIKPPSLLCLFMRNEEFIPGAAVMIQREVINHLGGYEDSFRDGFSDAVFSVKLCLAFPVFVSSECWYKYRKHPESYTYNSEKEEDYDITQVYLDWIGEYFSQKGVKDAEVWQALQNARRILDRPMLSRSGKIVDRLRRLFLPFRAGR